MQKIFWRLVIGGIIWAGVALSNSGKQDNMPADNLPENTSMSLPNRHVGEQDYLEQYNLLVDRYNQAGGKLTELGYRPKWGRADWIEQMANQYELIASVHASLQRLKPPSDMIEAHAARVTAMSICKTWAEQSRQAVIDKTYNKWVKIQDTLGVQCDDAHAEARKLYDQIPDLIWSNTPTPVPSPTLRPTRTPTPTKTPTTGEPARSPQKPSTD